MEKNVPAIRFEGFSGKWGKIKLKDLTDKDFTNGVFNDPKKVGRGYRLINVKDMYSGSSIDIEKLSLIDIDKSEFLKNKVEHGDIFFTRSSLVKEGIAFSNVNLSHDSNITFDGHLIRMQPSKTKSEPIFLAYVFKTLSARKQFILGGKTTTMTTIGQSDIARITIFSPLQKEQIQIGNFFQQLDTLISQHQQKHDKLLNIKKALLEKMFPKASDEGEMDSALNTPAIRFKGFSGRWENKKLGEDITNIVGGGTPSTGIKEYWNGDIDWYSPTEIGKEPYAYSSVKKITQLGFDKSSTTMLPAEKTVLFTSRAGIGDMAILKKDGCTNQGFQSFVVKDDYDEYFLFSAGNLIKTYALKHASGSTFLEISGKQLGQMRVKVPCFSEQTKIGTFFQQLDTLITQHQSQLTKLNHIKQAFLSKMFV